MATLEPGTLVGPYRIQARIGAGAMGEVYRAIDPRLGREVAIKVLSNPTVAHHSIGRFEIEVRAVAALAHPNIVAIFDIGDLNGIPYAVMELLDGETLRERLNRDGGLPQAEAVSFAKQIASALAAAHGKQIVHRDLKPENIFLLRHGSIKLVDFGIARVQLPDDLDTTERTGEGLIVGTVGYMAPEQARAGYIDARADLFAFGAVLYEMLSGRRAFHGSSAIDILSDIVRGVPPAFDSPHPMPDWLRNIVLTCLKVEADARYQTAGDLLSALERGHEARAQVPAAPERARQLSSIAVLPFVDMSQARDQDYLCEGIAEELITALGQIPGLKVASRTAAFRFGGAATDVRQAGSALGVECVLEGSVRTAGSRLRVTTRLTKVEDGYLLWSRQFDRALVDIFAVQDEMARTIVQTLKPAETAHAATMIAPATEATEAYTEYLKGRYHWNKRSEAGLRTAIDHFTAAIRLDPSYARGHAGLADASATLALYGLRPPHEVMPIGKSMALRALELSPDLAEAHVPLALVEGIYEWEWTDAERHFLKAIALAPQYSTACQWYASNCLVPLGRFDEARRAMARAAALDPTSMPISTSGGVIALYEGHPQEASEALRRTLALDAGFAPAHFFLGQALAECGDTRGGLIHAEEAVALSGRTPETLAGLACVSAFAGNSGRAREILDELNAMSQSRYVSPGLVGQIHAALGNEHEALDSLDAAYDLHASDLAWLSVRPVFRRLRENPRFVSLTERLGLQRTAS